MISVIGEINYEKPITLFFILTNKSTEINY